MNQYKNEFFSINVYTLAIIILKQRQFNEISLILYKIIFKKKHK